MDFELNASEDTHEDRGQLVDTWRGRLLLAREQYDLAVSDAKAAGTDFAGDAAPGPHGGQRLIRAIRAETAARSEYMRILREFTEIVISGKLPRD